MKYSKKIRGMSTALAFAFAFMVFSFSFAPKAYAAEANVVANVGMVANFRNNSNGGTGAHYFTNSVTTPVSNMSVGGNSLSSYVSTWSDFYFADTSGGVYSGLTKIYASYRFNKGTLTSDFWDDTTWNILFTNDYGQTSEGVVDKFASFVDASGIGGEGYALEAAYVGSEGAPIKNLRILRNDRTGTYVAGGDAPSIYVISCRVITSAYSAEIEQFDKIANEIAAQSDILLAMKGDIVAILQDIYTMTGDMYIAQNLLNGYIVQMLPLLENIDQTTTNIYALLSSQLAALETAIETASTTIEAAIEAQTAAMIAYLNELFNTGNQVPDETYQQQQDAENILDQMESLEKPDVETIVPDIGDIGNDDIGGALSSIFSSNLIVTMMTLSASLAFGAYVLFGKRS